jgi:hypothetical protein
MKWFSFAFLSLSLFSITARAGDPDLDYILKVLSETDCAQVQVLIAPNIGVIRWDGGSMRYLYDEDIEPLRAADVASGKLPLDTDRVFVIPNLNDSNWGEEEDLLVAELNRLFRWDRAAHPEGDCAK